MHSDQDQTAKQKSAIHFVTIGSTDPPDDEGADNDMIDGLPSGWYEDSAIVYGDSSAPQRRAPSTFQARAERRTPWANVPLGLRYAMTVGNGFSTQGLEYAHISKTRAACLRCGCRSCHGTGSAFCH